MSRSKKIFPFLLGIVVLTAFIPLSLAEILVVPREAFSDAAVTLPLPSNFTSAGEASVAAGSPAQGMFRKWGVTFWGSGATVPTLRFRVSESVNPIPPYFWTIINSGEPNAGHPMIVDFSIPARRVGFRLNLRPETASVRAFDMWGRLLGEVAAGQLSGWMGLESTASEGIAKLVIDYGDLEEKEEEIDDVVVDFIGGSRSFEVYIPQVGAGQAVINGLLASLRFTLRISNLQEHPVGGGVEVFDSEGQPLFLEIDGVEVSSLEFALAPSETIVVSGDSRGDTVTSGYALIRAEGPVSATAEYTVFDEAGEIVTEAGISATDPAFRMVGPVASSMELDLNSGVALVNTSEERAQVRVIVTGPNFSQSMEVDLGAGEHVAKFISELFPSIPGEFQGTIIVASTVPVAATILHTKKGLPLASFQLDTLEEVSRP